MSLIKTALLLAAVFAAAQAMTAFVFVDSTGATKETSTVFPINSTKISTGHYCLFPASAPSEGQFNYAALVATLQSNGMEVPVPGFVVTNTGWGDDCNPYGGTAVYTYDNTATLADSAFTATLTWNDDESAKKAKKVQLRK